MKSGDLTLSLDQARRLAVREDYPIHQFMMREYRVTVESAAKRA
jgi:hypothetical protein